MKKRYVTVKQIQNLDKIAINRYGVPSLALMENAGRGVAERIITRLKGLKGKKVTVICGLGNNAGDGFVIARHLINAKIKTNVLLIGKGTRLKADARVNYAILKKLKYAIKEVNCINALVLKEIKTANIVVDAIFGVGLNRNITEPFKGFVEAINEHAKFIVSVDIPSGLDGTRGRIYGVCVKANETVTFSFKKKGFSIKGGPTKTGRITVLDIGIPLKLKERIK